MSDAMKTAVRLGRKVKNTLDFSAGIKIVWIKDKDDTEYHEAKNEADLKKIVVAKDKLKIRFRVISSPQDVVLWVEYEPSQVHDGFC